MADKERLIDANKLKQRIEFISKDERNPLNITAIAYFALLELVDIMPTIEAEPVKHGQWTWDSEPVLGNPYGSYRCSNCGNRMKYQENYCCECGSKNEDGDNE